MNLALIIVVLVSMLHLSQKERKVWCVIQPLVTTRNEVDALLGRPTSGADNFFSYDTKDEHISVWFGNGKPNQADPCKWKVEKNIVFVYIVAPKNKLLLSEADIDLTQFKKENDFHGVNSFYYHNEDSGITISTRIRAGEEVIESIHRDPKLVDRQKFCPH